MSRAFYFIVARLPQRSAAYFLLFLLWGVVLWFLSAGHPMPKEAGEIPNLDKVAHFSYFFIGGSFLSMGCVLWSRCFRLGRGILLVGGAVVISVIGRLDEYHQTFTPGRSGNDMGDWIADSFGGLVGGYLIIFVIFPYLKRGWKWRSEESLNKK